MTEGTESIPEDLKPGYAPDPRSFQQILIGVFMIVSSPLLWEMSVAMDPTVAVHGKSWFPSLPSDSSSRQFYLNSCNLV
jgi:hypothetical protein